MALNRAFGLLLLAFVTLDPSSADLVGLQEAAKGRTLARFTQGDPANSECWDRAGKEWDKWVDHLRDKFAQSAKDDPEAISTLHWILGSVLVLAVAAYMFLKGSTAEPT